MNTFVIKILHNMSNTPSGQMHQNISDIHSTNIIVIFMYQLIINLKRTWNIKFTTHANKGL